MMSSFTIIETIHTQIDVMSLLEKENRPETEKLADELPNLEPLKTGKPKPRRT